MDDNTDYTHVDDHSASFLISLIYLCVNKKELEDFHLEVNWLFDGDEANKLYTKFEKEVIYEHFHNHLRSF
tara:strand:- start:1566 stop:1778 length:213 start_codon:yes stop_codon:yes gene_type:complete